MSSKVSERELESAVGAINDDFDGDKSVRPNWHCVRRLSSHGRQMALNGQVGASISLGGRN